MAGTVPNVEDTIPKSSMVPAAVECILWKGRQTKTCRQITGAIHLVGKQVRAVEENRHDGQERGLLENILKLNPLKGGEVSERKGREKRVDAEATVCKRPWG